MKELTHLSLFSGIGGMDLAAEWAGFKTAGQCEWADYPTRVLEKHWPDVPRWRDIRELTGESFYEKTGRRTADVISGGFPCQPFSVAGKRRGTEDDRFLWPEMVRVIQELRPTWAVGENVAGIVRMALPDILSELEACGYWTRAFLILACAVGARHRRYRVAIVAWNADSYNQDKKPEKEKREDPQSAGICTDVPDAQSKQRDGTGKTWTGRDGSADSGKDVQYADGKRCKEQHPVSEPDKERHSGGRYYTPENTAGKWKAESGLGGMVNGLPDWVDGYWDTEPDIPRIAEGVKNRISRIHALGNAVVPQQFYPIFRAIAQIERRK